MVPLLGGAGHLYVVLFVFGVVDAVVVSLITFQTFDPAANHGASSRHAASGSIAKPKPSDATTATHLSRIDALR